MSIELKGWEDQGARGATNADSPRAFVEQYVSPLFYRQTAEAGRPNELKQIISEKQFWRESAYSIFGVVNLKEFIISDWFPRAPGVYWSEEAERIRHHVWSAEPRYDSNLGQYFSPRSKMDLIEGGGIGTVRLLPRRIDGVDCWLATALTGGFCHSGIPLVLPEAVRKTAGLNWGERANVIGRVRLLRDAGLSEAAAYVHHAPPVAVFVDQLEPVSGPEETVITPVALFESRKESDRQRLQYTFVQCVAAGDLEVDAAAEWIERYAQKHSGRVITNFDEVRPHLMDAPLSYQRLVNSTFDKDVLARLAGPVYVQRVEKLTLKSQKTKVKHMGSKIKVGGSAIINIDSVLKNVKQTLTNSKGLDAGQKSELRQLVESLKAEIQKVKTTHSDEAAAVSQALEKAVENASKPAEDRKESLLQLSAKGLKDAAQLFKDIAPQVLSTAGSIAKFITGL